MRKRFVAMPLFMIFLVIAMPAAFAQQLDVTRFSGKDGADGIAGAFDDVLTVTVLAELQGSPSPDVARTRLRISSAGESEFFDSCTSVDSLYSCSYETSGIIDSGSVEYEIVLLDAENNELKSVSRILDIDDTAPEIVRFSVEPETSRTGDMSVEFFVEDYGRRFGDTASCAGLKEIVLTAGDSVLRSFEFDEPGVCESEESFDYSYSAQSDFAGLDVCLSARDYVGQESRIDCEPFRIDNSAPEIRSVEFRKDGFEVSHIKPGQEVVVDMLVMIDNEGDVESASADLSRLNPSLGVEAFDESSGDMFVWRDVAVTRPQDCAVFVQASDRMGNNASENLVCSLPVDDTGPVPVSFYASAADANGTPLIGVNGSVFVDFTEQGSGMDKGNAFLDMHTLGLGTVVQADDCFEKSPGLWTCEWRVVPEVGSGLHRITLLDGTSDDLGNYASQVSEKIVVDTLPPVISSVDITFAHENADYGPTAVYGDTVEFSFNGSDMVEAYANISSVGGGYAPAVECTGDSCFFSVLVDVSGPLNASIDFDFYDIALNKETYSYNFFVYGVLLNDTQTNYWKTKTTCSPRLIDRQSAEVFNHPVYCHVKLIPNNPRAEPVYAVPGDISECTGDFAGYVVDVEAINNNIGSRDPYLVFTLAAAPFAVNELKFSCPVYISTKVDDFFSPSVEVENVSVRLQFYNMPYGEMYTNTEREIQHRMRKAVTWADWIGQVEDVLDWMKKLCNTKSALTSTLSALELLIDWLGVFGAAVGLADQDVGEALVEQAKNLCNKGKSPIEKLLLPEPEQGPGDTVVPRKDKKKEFNLFNLLDLACKAYNCQLTREEADQYKGDWLVPASAVFGAGLSSGVCKNYKEFVSGGFAVDYDALTRDADFGGVDSPVDVKESIVGSVACFCLPGITYNLEKIRQINCGYAYCLGKRVLEEGVPRAYCADEKAYLTCNYAVGQAFEIVPFASLVDKYASIIQEAYANPISLLAAASALVCGGNDGRGGFYDYCADRGESLEKDSADIGMYVLCSVPKTAAKVTDFIASWQLAEKSWKDPVSNDYCEMAEDLME